MLHKAYDALMQLAIPTSFGESICSSKMFFTTLVCFLFSLRDMASLKSVVFMWSWGGPECP